MLTIQPLPGPSLLWSIPGRPFNPLQPKPSCDSVISAGRDLQRLPGPAATPTQDQAQATAHS